MRFCSYNEVLRNDTKLAANYSVKLPLRSSGHTVYLNNQYYSVSYFYKAGLADDVAGVASI